MPYGDYNWIANKLKTVYRNIKAIKNPKNSEEESFVFIRKTAFDGHRAIIELLSKVDEMEARNKRLEEARENANAACAKWEGLYRAELEKKGAWVSVKDRLPEDYQRVLCLFESGTMEVSFRASVKGFCYEGFKQTGKVTHWIPLPEPPKEE